MKYMGSKRHMLANGLGDLLHEHVENFDRFVDLFTGSTAVACHVAERYDVEVVTNDLQSYSSVLAKGVLSRTKKLDVWWVWNWLNEIRDLVQSHYLYPEVSKLQNLVQKKIIESTVNASRGFCFHEEGTIFGSYGGFYYSPLQALEIDIIRQNLPKNPDQKAIAFAALIQAASSCSASPGHTAQPFSPTVTAGPYIVDAWNRDLINYVRMYAHDLCDRHSKNVGQSYTADANLIARKLRKTDLVFLDPPYSGVHYSRFYHVLETIARGEVAEVSGAGRYPPAADRPNSEYSKKTTSYEAMKSLLIALQKSGCSAILTYPAGKTSNGLNGEEVSELVSEYFSVGHSEVKGKFSTLGGNKRNREARVASNELLLFLEPKEQEQSIAA